MISNNVFKVIIAYNMRSNIRKQSNFNSTLQILHSWN